MCQNGTIFVPPRNTDDSQFQYYQRLNPAKYIKQRVIREQKLMRVSSNTADGNLDDGGNPIDGEKEDAGAVGDDKNRLHSLN